MLLYLNSFELTYDYFEIFDELQNLRLDVLIENP